MMGWLWAAVAVAVAATISLASRVRIKLFFSRAGKDDHWLVEFRALYGIVRYKYDVPLIRFRDLFHLVDIRAERIDRNENVVTGEQESNISLENIRSYYHQARQFTKRIDNFTGWMKQTLTGVHCSRFQWETRIGVGDAAETAIATGLIWALKTSLLGFCFRYIKLEARPELLVQPQYNRKQFMVNIQGDFHFRLALLLFAGTMLLVRFRRAGRGQRKRKPKLESHQAG